jgi:hypothetical protein
MAARAHDWAHAEHTVLSGHRSSRSTSVQAWHASKRLTRWWCSTSTLSRLVLVFCPWETRATKARAACRCSRRLQLPVCELQEVLTRTPPPAGYVPEVCLSAAHNTGAADSPLTLTRLHCSPCLRWMTPARNVASTTACVVRRRPPCVWALESRGLRRTCSTPFQRRACAIPCCGRNWRSRSISLFVGH